MYKKIASTIIVATLLVSLILSLGTVAVTKAQAIQSITLSASYLNDYSVLEIIVYAPGYEEDYIELKVKNATTDEDITSELSFNGSLLGTGMFVAYKYASGYYVAYLGGNKTDIGTSDIDEITIPENPKKLNATSSWTNIAAMPESNTDQDYVVYVPGTDVEATFTYGYVLFSLSLERDPAEYPPNAYAKLSVVDQDFNLDPTAPDKCNGTQIPIAKVVVQRTSEGKVFSESWEDDIQSAPTLNEFIDDNATESKVNSATFVFVLNFTKLTQFLSNKVNPELSTLEDGDIVEITLSDLNYSKTVTFEFTVKEVTPTITLPKLGFSDEITVQVEWFDKNIRSWDKDEIAYGDFTVLLVDASNASKVYDKEKIGLEETDDNTAVFTNDTLELTWNSTSQGQPNNGKLEVPLPLAKEGTEFLIKVNCSDAERYFDLTLHAPTLTTDKTEYTIDEVVKVTLIDPDLNDDADVVESYNITVIGANDKRELYNAYATAWGTKTPFLNVTLYDKTKGDYVDYYGNITFIETGKNTGEFVAKLYFDKMKVDTEKVEEGDTLKLTITDWTSGEDVSVEFKLVKITRAIELDRSTYPVPKDKSVVVYVKFTAPDYNEDPDSRDLAPVNVTLIFYDGSTESLSTLDLMETDVNTGVFEGSFEIPTKYGLKLINGKVRVWYDAYESGKFESDKDVYAEASFRVTTASMSVTPLSLSYGEDIVITVYDPDANLDSKEKEKITVSFENSVSETQTLTLEETEPNSGTFSGTFTVGKDKLKDLKPGDTVTFKYHDGATAASVPGKSWSEMDIKVSIKIKTNTGVLMLDKAEYGPGALMNITLVDPDLNVNLERKDHHTVTVKVEGITTEDVEVEETGINTGVFTNTTYRLPTTKDAIGKRVLVAYKDEADATGESVTITVEAVIKSWDPEISFDKDYYKIGELAKITIKDPDQNLDPSRIDNCTLLVYTDSDPLGIVVEAYETDVNTGVFEAYVLISDSFGKDRVYAKYGDKVYVEYEDPYPADYAVTEESKTFTATATVGIPVEKPFEIATPAVVDPTTGAEVTETTVGKMVAISTTLENIDVVERTFAYVVQVKDSAGVVVYLSYIEGTVPAGYSFTPTISWTPTAPGVYTVEVFVWKSVAEPTAYSPVLTLTITVSE